MTAMSGRPFCTDEDMKRHREWLEKQQSLAAKYGPVLEKAGSSEERREIIRQFYEETGAVPFTVRTSMVMSMPYVAELAKYEDGLTAQPAANIENGGSWTCSLCGNENSGRFCSECGNPR